MFHYDPSLFLRPIICTLHDHFPVDDSKNFIYFDYSNETFLKTPQYRYSQCGIHYESHPISRFDCPTVILAIHFSSLRNIPELSFELKNF
jgi:hypothetical protein